MKYLVRTDEEQYWNILYSVEADSADEAEQIVRDRDWNRMEEIDSDFIETGDINITDIEPPYNEDV